MCRLRLAIWWRFSSNRCAARTAGGAGALERCRVSRGRIGGSAWPALCTTAEHVASTLLAATPVPDVFFLDEDRPACPSRELGCRCVASPFGRLASHAAPARSSQASHASRRHPLVRQSLAPPASPSTRGGLATFFLGRPGRRGRPGGSSHGGTVVRERGVAIRRGLGSGRARGVGGGAALVNAGGRSGCRHARCLSSGRRKQIHDPTHSRHYSQGRYSQEGA